MNVFLKDTRDRLVRFVEYLGEKVVDGGAEKFLISIFIVLGAIIAIRLIFTLVVPLIICGIVLLGIAVFFSGYDTDND